MQIDRRSDFSHLILALSYIHSKGLARFPFLSLLAFCAWEDTTPNRVQSFYQLCWAQTYIRNKEPYQFNLLMCYFWQEPWQERATWHRTDKIFFKVFVCEIKLPFWSSTSWDQSSFRPKPLAAQDGPGASRDLPASWGFSGYHQGSSEQLPQSVALTETLAVSSLWVWLIAGFTTAAVRMLDEDADGLPLGPCVHID